MLIEITLMLYAFLFLLLFDFHQQIDNGWELVRFFFMNSVSSVRIDVARQGWHFTIE